MEGWTEQAVYYKETKGKTLISFDPEISESLTIEGCVRVSVSNIITHLSHRLSE